MSKAHLLFTILLSFCLLPSAFCLCSGARCQVSGSSCILPTDKNDSAKKAAWLPSGNLFPSCRFDFMESQFSGAIYGFYANNRWQNRIFGNFSAGLRRNVIRWAHKPERSSELGFELSIFTQFLFEEPFADFQTNLFNIEYKVGAHYQYRMSHWNFRGRIYHISAHLGDDYLFRNGIDEFMDNPRIYEVIDLSAAWMKNGWQFYGTAGVIFHSAYERDLLLLQAGVQYKRYFRSKDWLGWITGADIRMEQEQSFRPGIHTGIGLIMGRAERFPFTLMVDWYNGYMPYSLYDKVLINWIGASLYFDPF